MHILVLEVSKEFMEFDNTKYTFYFENLHSAIMQVIAVACGL